MVSIVLFKNNLRLNDNDVLFEACKYNDKILPIYILDELNTFDQYDGHPAPGDDYHYHIEPSWLTENLGDDAFLGLLLDGFPVYGPVENGSRLSNDDLDDYHGHIHNTTDFPEGIYHYHITDELPWINGDGFYGQPGTITR